jgi:hypothetical protein
MDEDEMFDIDEDDLRSEVDGPDFRATVKRSGAVRLVYWGPWLQLTGPAYTMLAGRDRAGIGVADLRVVRDDEGMATDVIVEFHSGGTVAHRTAILGWARDAGYGRVWFEREVADLEPAEHGLVGTRCTGCGERFVDGRSGHFWRHVRAAGVFPVACSLCGSDLPQWTPVHRKQGNRRTQPGKRKASKDREHARRR